jgi:pilus assembly protein CpaE
MARSSLAVAKSEDDNTPIVQGRVIPRISIAAFCSSGEVQDVVQRVAADRRLAKTHLAIHSGGIPEAFQMFSDHPTPSLLILEAGSDPATILAQLEELAGVCEETTKAIVIGHTNDVVLYRELMNRGISEYLLAPVEPLRLIDSIANLYMTANASIGRVVVFTGARGGVGASTLAHNFGWTVADMLHAHTAIMDFDFAFGTASLNFNQTASQGIIDALTAPDRIDAVLLDRLFSKSGEYLSLLNAPAVLDQEYEFSPAVYEKLIEQARTMMPCIVIDLPHHWTPSSRHILNTADEVVIVATPDLAALRNARNLLQAVQSRRVNDSPAKLVLNQVGIPKRPEISLKDFTATAGQAPDLVVPFEAQLFGSAANNGKMFCEFQPKSKPAEAIRQLARTIAGRHAPVGPSAKSGLLTSLLKRKAG